MREVEPIKVTIEKKRVMKIQCDFCDANLFNLRDSQIVKELEENFQFDISGVCPSAEVTVKIEMSNSYSDMGGSKDISLDVCPSCFKKEILSKAKQFSTEERSW